MTCMNFPFPRDYVLLMIAPQNQVHEIQVKKNTTVFDMKQQYANISVRYNKDIQIGSVKPL